MELLSNLSGEKGVGIDIQLLSELNIENDTFLERNFTPSELAEAEGSLSKLCEKWSAKEATIKAVSSFSLDTEQVWNQGVGAPLIGIEILQDVNGNFKVTFYGDAKDAVAKAGVTHVSVSIQSNTEYAMAIATAK
ncbi:fatty acid synthase alpha subunit Lsd1 [Basidiobolus ranarum]|uniref:Fatty acid synthase alpha subunit Lsd1 n=1 Tax=Basidiobolus ranarum TaxID=34480 RepID=A0ABR2WWB4_9FUNG